MVLKTSVTAMMREKKVWRCEKFLRLKNCSAINFGIFINNFLHRGKKWHVLQLHYVHKPFIKTQVISHAQCFYPLHSTFWDLEFSILSFNLPVDLSRIKADPGAGLQGNLLFWLLQCWVSALDSSSDYITKATRTFQQVLQKTILLFP